MQDLLNEKEFAPKYDPWKNFYRFYGIALLQLPVLVGVCVIGVELLPDAFGYFLAVAMLAPVVTAGWMFLYKKENREVPFGTMVYAVSGLLLSYYIPVMAAMLIMEGAIDSGLILVCFICHFLLSLAAVIVFKEVVLPWRDKKNKR